MIQRQGEKIDPEQVPSLWQNSKPGEFANVPVTEETM